MIQRRDIRSLRHYVVAALLTTTLAIASACGGSSDQETTPTNNDKDTMVAAMKAGDCTTAMKMATQLITNDERSAAAALGHVVAFNCALLDGDHGVAKAHAAALQSIPDETGLLAGMALYLDATLAYQTGDMDTAKRLGAKAVVQARDHNLPKIAAMTAVLLALAFQESGDCTAASAMAEHALIFSKKTGESSASEELSSLLGMGKAEDVGDRRRHLGPFRDPRPRVVVLPRPRERRNDRALEHPVLRHRLRRRLYKNSRANLISS